MRNRKMLFVLSCVIALLFIETSCEDTNLKSITSALPGTGKTEPATTSAPTISNLIYFETVEGPTPFSTAHDLDVGSWDYALQFVTSPFYKGLKSARFEIRKDQPLVADGKRSEVTIVKDEVQKDMWYSFAVYFPSVGYEYDTEREVINQWYQSGTPATSLRTQKDRILLETGNTESSRVKIDLGAIPKDTWNTFVIHFIHSYGTDGLIELWLNGTKKISRTGGNMYNIRLPKWKIGLYKSAFKDNTSLVSKRIIYFDNIKVGNSTSTYETMIPGL